MSNDTETRTRAVAQYIISHTRPEDLGAVKLRKVMWDADVAFYRRHGRTITGQQSYVRMPQGPVPNGINQALADLVKERKIVVRIVPTPVGERYEYVVISPLSAAGFLAEEIEALHGAIEAICPLTARQASEATHGPLWASIENGSQMPVRAEAIVPGELEPEDVDWALAAAPGGE